MASKETESSFIGCYQPTISWVRAKCDYAGRDDRELSFKTGDLIEVLDDLNQDWWHGELWNQKGLFPVRCVEVMQRAARSDCWVITQPLAPDDGSFHEDSSSSITFRNKKYEDNWSTVMIDGWMEPQEEFLEKSDIRMSKVTRSSSDKSDSSVSSFETEIYECVGLDLQEDMNRPMTCMNVTKLRQARSDITRDLYVQDVLSFMMGENVITGHMKEEIMAKSTRLERCGAFLDRLETRGERAFHVFMHALKADYIHLYHVLQNITVDKVFVDINMDFPRAGEARKSGKEVSALRTDGEGEREKKKNRVRSRANQASREGEDISGLIKRATQLKTMGEDAVQDVSQYKAQVISTFTVGNITLRTNEFVVALRKDTGRPTTMYILNKKGCELEVPKTCIKSFGDPSHENYFYKQKLLPSSAMQFMKEELKETPLDGIYFLYKPMENSSPAKYHLCVGEIDGTVKDYPIIQLDEGFMISKDHKPFDTIIELIDYFTYTRSNVLEVPLGRCLNDAQNEIKPGSDYDDKWEITANELEKKGKRIGNGFFSIVQKTRYQGKEVAVKSLNNIHQSHAHKDQFLKEAKLLMEMEHENILQLIGVRFSKEPYLIITEYLNKGTLQSALISERISYKDGGGLMKNVITPIASAMRYLESRNIVHRDLASRNILLGENNIIRLIDFGLSRKLRGHTGKYVATKKETIVNRWAAPEVIATLNFTIKSDIWAFGVLLWEIYSGGRRPYQHLKNHEIAGFVLVEGGRLDKPPNCPDDLYQTMHACWNLKLDERPSFAELHQAFDSENLSSVRKQRISRFLKEDDYMPPENVPFLDFNTYEDVYVKLPRTYYPK